LKVLAIVGVVILIIFVLWITDGQAIGWILELLFSGDDDGKGGDKFGGGGFSGGGSSSGF
jgi:hypothetical protein